MIASGFSIFKYYGGWLAAQFMAQFNTVIYKKNSCMYNTVYGDIVCACIFAKKKPVDCGEIENRKKISQRRESFQG